MSNEKNATNVLLFVIIAGMLYFHFMYFLNVFDLILPLSGTVAETAQLIWKNSRLRSYVRHSFIFELIFAGMLGVNLTMVQLIIFSYSFSRSKEYLNYQLIDLYIRVEYINNYCSTGSK